MKNQAPFGIFIGRARETERILHVMKALGVFDDMPYDTVDFIRTHYNPKVPYHNTIHVLYGLLWLHMLGAPLLVKLAWIGHDAGHNGNKSESTETMSAYLTWMWLVSHQKWLAERGVDPQDCTIPIMSTKMPYKEGFALHEEVQWLRWTDVIRGHSGGTARYLHEQGTEIGTRARFCAFFYENAPIFYESNYLDFSTALEDKGLPFFGLLERLLQQEVLCATFVVDWEIIYGDFFEIKKLLCELLKSERGEVFLQRSYDFLSSDVTYPEFYEFAMYFWPLTS